MKLELRAVTKHFGSLAANKNVDLVVEPGQIHGLLGENGAGKTTLMNVLYGMITPDSGQILINDEVVTIRDPKDAVRTRSAWCTSTSCSFRSSRSPTTSSSAVNRVKPWPFIDHRSATERIVALAKEYNFDIDPSATIENLPIGTQQRVEILKALSHDAEILILDEPTAVLTPQEADALMVVMRTLKSQGKSIIFITHKLKEVLEIADVITVMRLGQVVGTTTPAETNEAALATMMVGRDVSLVVEKPPANPGDVVLEVTNLFVQDDRGLTAVKGVSFEVRAGEILAFAGVQGNGQTELVEALTGLRRATAGSVVLNGIDLVGHSVRDVLDAGVGHVPEDRQRHGLVLSMSIADNLVLDQLDSPQYKSWSGRKLKAIAGERQEVASPSTTFAPRARPSRSAPSRVATSRRS